MNEVIDRAAGKERWWGWGADLSSLSPLGYVGCFGLPPPVASSFALG
jgi:hypothetical protein